MGCSLLGGWRASGGRRRHLAATGRGSLSWAWGDICRRPAAGPGRAERGKQGPAHVRAAPSPAPALARPGAARRRGTALGQLGLPRRKPVSVAGLRRAAAAAAPRPPQPQPFPAASELRPSAPPQPRANFRGSPVSRVFTSRRCTPRVWLFHFTTQQGGMLFFFFLPLSCVTLSTLLMLDSCT